MPQKYITILYKKYHTLWRQFYVFFESMPRFRLNGANTRKKNHHFLIKNDNRMPRKY
jgi:hypothetical protein